ncbi:hypothetical protein EsDP_00006662 [Epichloe bromicola]|uniref:Uncharacterized protein n=1 Tax=Epichloe bromicola TaxID=79588 RepID=A0ABQ0CYQ3_9HYPO
MAVGFCIPVCFTKETYRKVILIRTAIRLGQDTSSQQTSPGRAFRYFAAVLIQRPLHILFTELIVNSHRSLQRLPVWAAVHVCHSGAVDLFENAAASARLVSHCRIWGRRSESWWLRQPLILIDLELEYYLPEAPGASGRILILQMRMASKSLYHQSAGLSAPCWATMFMMDAAAFPSFALQMYKALGVGWATSLLGFIAVAMAPIPCRFWWKQILQSNLVVEPAIAKLGPGAHPVSAAVSDCHWPHHRESADHGGG